MNCDGTIMGDREFTKLSSKDDPPKDTWLYQAFSITYIDKGKKLYKEYVAPGTNASTIHDGVWYIDMYKQYVADLTNIQKNMVVFSDNPGYLRVKRQINIAIDAAAMLDELNNDVIYKIFYDPEISIADLIRETYIRRLHNKDNDL